MFLSIFKKAQLSISQKKILSEFSLLEFQKKSIYGNLRVIGVLLIKRPSQKFSFLKKGATFAPFLFILKRTGM